MAARMDLDGPFILKEAITLDSSVMIRSMGRGSKFRIQVAFTKELGRMTNSFSNERKI